MCHSIVIFIADEIKRLLAAQEALLSSGGKMDADQVAPAIVTVLSELIGDCLEFAQELYTKYETFD